MFLALREGRLGRPLYCLNLGIHVRGIFMVGHNDEKNGLGRAARSTTNRLQPENELRDGGIQLCN